ncbi:MAG: glycosyltransferase family 2 protein [Litoreibacter sp.]|nr:glycosyltransferase family 2 protein [Litoreibacter sp.]
MRGEPSLAPSNVVVCIATYRRPTGLKALLESLNTQEFSGPEPDVTLVVVDNDPANPAHATLGDLSALTRWPVIYVAENTRGIVAARNRALEEAPPDTDFFVFVDDDETVVANWLNALITTQLETGATAVQGPMVPRYETTPPTWIERLRIFDIGPFQQGEQLGFAATGNSLVDAHFVKAHGLRFDTRFNTSGGEDEEFFGRVREAGGVIRAAADAIAYDEVPTGRMTCGWVLRRAFRMGNTLGRVALLRRRGRGLRFLKGFGAAGRGLLYLFLLGPFSKAGRIRGLMEIWRGAGMLAAFVNFRFAEYSDTLVAGDRDSVT